MADDKKEKLVECEILSPLRRNDVEHKIGDSVKLTADEAETLTLCGAVKRKAS